MKKNQKIIIVNVVVFLLLIAYMIWNRDVVGGWLLSDKATQIENHKLQMEEKMMKVMKENAELKSKIKYLSEQKSKKPTYVDENKRVYDGLRGANELNNKIAQEADLDLSERAAAYNKICGTKLKKEDAEMRIQLYISYMQPKEEQLKKIYSLKENELSQIPEILGDKNFVQHLCKNKLKAEKTILVE